LDISIRSGDIRHPNLKLSEIAAKFGLPILGAGLLKVVPTFRGVD